MKVPHTAMVLAAGLGLRMRPLTLDKPKPLLEVGGCTMLDLAFDKLVAAGVKKVVVNTYYKAEMIEAHLKRRSDCAILVSHEAELLDTGGGIKKALTLLGSEPVFVVNSDLPWQDGAAPALAQLASAFDESRMDALLLVGDLQGKHTHGFDRKAGDFFIRETQEKFGPLYRKDTKPPRPYVFISAQIVKPQLFANVVQDIFSTNIVWDEAEKRGTLFGLIHDGACYHVGTPQDLAESNRLLAEGHGW